MKSRSERLPASVIVVTRNRAESLARTLDALAILDYPDYEVIVVDHCSEDETANVIEKFGARRVEAAHSCGIGHCRKLGVEAARGEIVAMCDDDCVPVPGWLAAMETRLRKNREVGLLGGRVVNVGFPEAQRFKGLTRLAGPNGVVEFARTPEEADFFGNANLGFRKAAIEAIGGYDPFFRVGEELDLALTFRRAGLRIGYEPTAEVRHFFTGISYKRGPLFRGPQLMRLYRHLKHFPPDGLGGWSDFWLAEFGLMFGDLYRVARLFGSAMIHLRASKLIESFVALSNALSSRLAVPWLVVKARRRWAQVGASDRINGQ